MLFTITNKYKTNPDILRTRVLTNAYFVIKCYPMHSQELVLENFIKQQYKKSLKDLCIELLLNLKFQIDKNGNLILLFTDIKYDRLAQLITFGNGAVPGSQILQAAFNR